MIYTELMELKDRAKDIINKMMSSLDGVVLTDSTPISFLDKHGNYYDHCNLLKIRKEDKHIVLTLESEETFFLDEVYMSADDLVYIITNIEDVAKILGVNVL